MRTELVFNNSSPLRSITAKVEVFNTSTDAATYTHNDALKSIKVSRLGEESKFFGFGISQKATIELLDPNKTININKEGILNVLFDDVYNFPELYPTDIKRDEKSGNLTITAEDKLGTAATEHTVSELEHSDTIGDMVEKAAKKLGLRGAYFYPDSVAFNTQYPEGANFDGTETFRELFNAAAEATQTVYHINSQNSLIFKRLEFDKEPVLTVDKELYFELTKKQPQQIGGIVSATELGDNVGYIPDPDGITQYVNNNPFWELREDIAELITAAVERVLGGSITPFTCSWRGDYRTEPGDKLAFVEKDGNIFYSYLINDTLEYNGGLKQTTSWSFGNERNKTSSNSSTLGEVIKQTFARVDKVNKDIELLASENNALTSEMANLRLDTESINATVQSVEKQVENNLDNINNKVAELTSKVEASITAQDVNIAIKTELDNGVEKVITTTGYTLDEEGLKISKSGSDLNTTITENGMEVKSGDTAVLTANNVGVDAANLHATTYLIIGNNSRFEDYGYNRTGCFWIGG